MIFRLRRRGRGRRYVRCVAVGAGIGCWLLSLFSTHEAAGIYAWRNSLGDDDFTQVDNWFPVLGPPAVPGSGDIARFDGQLQGAGVGDNDLHVPDGTAIGSMEISNSTGYPPTVVDMTIGDGTTGSRFDLNGAAQNLWIAAGDTATLNLLGGSFYSGRTLVGGKATLNVSGIGSYWDAEYVDVSGDTNADTAAIMVENQANVRSGVLTIGGDHVGGRVVIDGYTPGIGTRPLWEVEGPVRVGSFGSTSGVGFGKLTIQRGGRMSAGEMVFIRGTTVQSTIAVESAGELTALSGWLQIDHNGLLELHDAASVVRVGTFFVDNGGAFDWTGGTLEVTDSPVLLGASAGYTLGTASLVVDNGMKLKATAGPSEPSLVVGRDLAAALAVQGGGLVECYRGYIGESAGSNGTVTVDGAAQTPTDRSTFTSQSTLGIGGTVSDGDPGTPGGSGKLTVKNGGLVDVASTLKVWSGGRVEMLTGGGQPPSEVHVGEFLNQEGGTFVHDDGVLTVHGGEFAPNAGGGYSIDSPGTSPQLPKVVLDEEATYTSTGTLHVGEHYSGLLEIRGGSRVSTFNGRIGTDAGTSYGNVLVDGHGGGYASLWSNDEDLEVGVRSHGYLTISGGGLVTDKHGEIAAVPGSVGSVTVDDGGTWRNSIGLVVGGNSFGAGGQGTLNTRAGGRVEADYHVRVYPNGLVSMLGGEIHAGPGGFFIEGGELQGTGDVVLSGGGDLGNDGRVSPGIAVPGPLTIAGGDYVQYSGTALNVDIAGTDPAEYSRLEITSGVAYLNGTMHVNLISGPYTPAAGDRFEILTAAGGLSGTEFDSLVAPSRPGLAWDLVYEPTVVALEVFLDADFDHDRTVSGNDFLIWQRGYGSGNPAHIDGDANGDGNVDAADLARWKQTFGNRVSSMPLTATVPEPASGALWGMSAWAILVYLNKRRK